MSSEPQGPSSEEIAQDNERLVRSIADGDHESERVFVERYHQRVRVMLLARSRNPDLAADLAQDVMIEGLCALRRGQIQDPAKLTAFILAIARNTLNNYFRTSSRAVAVELLEDLPEFIPEAIRREEQEWESRALKAISSLEPVDRTILEMTLIDGLKPGVIAERLRMSPDLVRQRKLRATRRVIELVNGASQRHLTGHIAVERTT